MTYWQYLIKVGRRKKKIEKYFKSSCLRELKIEFTYKSRDEYCLVIAERSLSRAPEPPLAVLKVGLAAVVILNYLFQQKL